MKVDTVSTSPPQLLYEQSFDSGISLYFFHIGYCFFMARSLHGFSKAEDMYLPHKLRDKCILSSLMKYAHLTQLNVICRENEAKSKFLKQMEKQQLIIYIYLVPSFPQALCRQQLSQCQPKILILI